MTDRYTFRGKYNGTGDPVDMAPGDWFIGSLFTETSMTDGVALVGVDPATVGQCTGLKDANGKLIFEGDILKWRNPDEDSCEFNAVIWCKQKCRFGVMVKDIAIPDFDYFDGYGTHVVVGNIHDNPDFWLAAHWMPLPEPPKGDG